MSNFIYCDKHAFDSNWRPCPACEEEKRNLYLMDRSNFKRVHDALHTLWTKARGGRDYVKAEWRELDNAISVLANDGPGDLVREGDPE